MALSAAKEGFGFTINLYTNFSVKLEAERDFKLGLLSAEGNFRYMALYIEFLVGELGGHSKEIFKFRMEPCAVNIPFKDLIFGAG